MKLFFIIDQDYDFAVIYELLKQDKGSEKFTAKIDSSLLKKGSSLKREEFVRELKEYTQKEYGSSLYFLEKTAKLYQSSWDEINENFFSTTKEITGFEWKHKEYFCVVSFFNKGISSWGGNKIIRGWNENPYLMRKITAHELLISHIFSIFEKKDFAKYNLDNNKKWKIAEISAFAICGLEKKMIEFWPWIREEEKYPLNHNYQHIYKDQKNLKSFYENKKSFKSFLEKAIEGIED
jgi:hypothetical protein